MTREETIKRLKMNVLGMEEDTRSFIFVSMDQAGDLSCTHWGAFTSDLTYMSAVVDRLVIKAIEKAFSDGEK